MKRFYVACAYLVLSFSASADWRQGFMADLKNGAAVAETSTGERLFSHAASQELIPASVLKVATSYCGLEELGPDFRFVTGFFLDAQKRLFVQGGGDPALVSEDLATIAKEIAKRTAAVSGITIDDSLFGPIVIDGASATLNPYDAPNGAFLVNFNTIAVRKPSLSTVEPGEPQTPLTPLSRELAKGLPRGEHRINIGKDVKKGARYGGELLAAFLEEQGVKVTGAIQFGRVSSDAEPLYSYRSSKPLTEVVRNLLKYSTNFSANQIFLTLGMKKFGVPATVEKGQRAFDACLRQKAGWKQFHVAEGAGLSRKNRVTVNELMVLLEKFERYRSLLPRSSVFEAKTGTLTGVNSYAGYFDLPEGRPVRFAIVVNSPVPFDYKLKMAAKLYRGLAGKEPPPFAPASH